MENQKKKSGCLKWGLIAVAAFLVLGAVTSIVEKDAPNADTSSSSVASSVATASANTSSTASGAESEDAQDNDSEAVTTGQRNALRKAKEYLAVMAFSRDGLVHQLEFENFSSEEAAYAADNVNADWNEQAVKKGEEYLAVMAFSRDGLVHQLEFDGFTTEQAEYGAQANGY